MHSLEKNIDIFQILDDNDSVVVTTHQTTELQGDLCI